MVHRRTQRGVVTRSGRVSRSCTVVRGVLRLEKEDENLEYSELPVE